MSDILDLGGAKDEKARRMLETDEIVWFATVGRDGEPHAVPVWFYWFDGKVIVFSEPDTVKVKHVREGSPVLVHLQAGGPHADDVVILNGRAEISERDAASWLDEFGNAYVEKYADAVAAYGLPLQDIVSKFSTALVFTPQRALTW
ncbi:pyridoxamine 5'-phosphate oxidase family protein [Microbacterium sp. P05]|uniref:pyridoxamine 5'-phosphate oxidase family protein n=1 Tax=Microbacterium sp. P05 TaxID=3366948 RepID=UPI003746D5CE